MCYIVNQNNAISVSFQRFFILLFFCTISCSLFAQRVSVDQSFGLAATTSDITGMARGVKDSTMYDASFSARVHQFGIVYAPRVDLLGNRIASISISAPFMLGLSSTSKYQSVDFNGVKRDTIQGVSGANLAFELPVFADINIGLRSARDESRRSLGIYAGAGYMYSYTKIKTSVGKMVYDGFDPVFRAGIRLGSAWENRFSIAFTLRGKPGGDGIKTYGLQLLKEL